MPVKYTRRLYAHGRPSRARFQRRHGISYPKSNFRNGYIPISIKCPGNPPPIRLTVPKYVQLSDRITLSEGAGSYTYGDLKTIIQSQIYASTTASFKYQIIKVAAWGSAGNSRLSMTDTDSGQEISDVGSYSGRPSLCFLYPLAAQTVEDQDSTGNKVTFNSTDQTAIIELRIAVRVWAMANNS